MRAGRYISQPAGYCAFIPNPLPPQPPIALDEEMWNLLSKADLAVGRLDGSTETLPSPDLFVFMYVRREAVLSSQIEGTQASLIDVLEFEAQAAEPGHPEDVAEVVNYVVAMNHGLERLEKLPVSLRLIRDIHAKLMQGVKGAERNPGEFRNSQNWVGPPGSTLANARYVPPPRHEMRQALDNFEKFLHQEYRGDWEGWLKFFLQGVVQVAEEATVNARRIVKMREEHCGLILNRLGRASSKALQLLERLYFRPIVSVQTVSEITGLSFANANSLARQLEAVGLLRETTGRKRNRRFSYEPYLRLFQESQK